MNRQPEPVDSIIGTRIRDLRRRAGLSQTEMGEAIGVSFQQIQKYENATNRISASKLWALAGHLDVELGEFFPTRAPVR